MFRSVALLLWIVLLIGCSKTHSGSSSVEPIPKPAMTAEKPEPTQRSEPTIQLVELTEGAAAQINKVQQEQGGSLTMEVGLDTSYNFKFDLIDAIDPAKHYTRESHGITVAITRDAATAIPGYIVVDFVHNDTEQHFKIVALEADLPETDTSLTLSEARKGFETDIVRRVHADTELPTPPAEIFEIVEYKSPLGMMPAYRSPAPKDGKRHPAILWIRGSLCSTLDAGCWTKGAPGSNMSASEYRDAGMILMMPSMRGGNKNPGSYEGLYGELDDALAAADYLRSLPFVDPERVYIGGHSIGGTLALLLVESTDMFRAAFSFGPTDQIVGYPIFYNPFDLSDMEEARLRSPGIWFHNITTPTFIFEGTSGNSEAVRRMAKSTDNPNIHCFVIENANHVSVVGAINEMLAKKIVKDTGPKCNITVTKDEVQALYPPPK